MDMTGTKYATGRRGYNEPQEMLELESSGIKRRIYCFQAVLYAKPASEQSEMRQKGFAGPALRNAKPG